MQVATARFVLAGDGEHDVEPVALAASHGLQRGRQFFVSGVVEKTGVRLRFCVGAAESVL